MVDIEDFIDEFRNSQADYVEDGDECVRHLFRAGYCYYFAKILQTAYPGGQVCLAFPKKHFVYKYAGQAWDIEGQYADEAWWIDEAEIPNNVLRPFKHLSGNPNAYKDVDAWMEQMKTELKDLL